MKYAHNDAPRACSKLTRNRFELCCAIAGARSEVGGELQKLQLQLVQYSAEGPGQAGQAQRVVEMLLAEQQRWTKIRRAPTFHTDGATPFRHKA